MNHLKQISIQLRQQLIVAHSRAKHSHIGTSFSCLDILVALYYEILKIDPRNPKYEKRDRFILSKGHGASAFYATLASKKLIPQEWMDHYQENGSRLSGHPDRLSVPFVEISAGSLGHGLPIGLGMAFALRLDENLARVFVLMSDGEIQEGTTWESANNAARLKLDNLTAIVDANKLQSYEKTDNIMPIKSFRAKWEAFGWAVREVDGHNFEEIVPALKAVPFEKGKPSIIIAHTIKGKGIQDFENELAYHYWPPREEHVERYLKELESTGGS